jgi:hypothetical protein
MPLLGPAAVAIHDDGDMSWSHHCSHWEVFTQVRLISRHGHAREIDW